MAGYILRRLAATLPVMLIVALFVFLMLRLTPGDPAAIIAGDNANAEQITRRAHPPSARFSGSTRSNFRQITTVPGSLASRSADL